MAIAVLDHYLAGQNGNSTIEVLVGGKPTTSPAFPSVIKGTTPIHPSVGTAVTGETSVPRTAPAAPDTSRLPQRKVVTLNDLVARFNAESQHLAANTRSTMGFHFKVAARHLDFSRDITSITLSDMKQLKSQLATDHKGSSVNDILFKGLGGLFRIAVEDELLSVSPLARLPKMKKKEPHREQPSLKEGLALVGKIMERSEESALIVWFMLFFGVGQAEIRALQGEHVDLKAREIRFRRQKTAKLFEVPITPDVLPFLEELAGQGRLIRGQAVVKWRNPRKALAAACTELGLPVYAPRALRRTFIVNCLERGVDPRVVAKWQGHADSKLILSVYGKFISPEHERQQVEKLCAPVPAEAKPATA